MKKSYLMIAAASVLTFAACSNEVLVEKESLQNNSEQALSFTAFTNKVTKAPNTNSVELNDFYTVFGVYGWKTVKKATDPTQTENKSVFNNVPNEYFTADQNGVQQVYKDAGEKPSIEWAVASPFVAAWYYEDVRYWDKMADSYQFFAIAPYESTPIYSVNADDDNIAIASSTTPYNIQSEKNLSMTATDPAVPQTNLIYSGFNRDFMIADKVTVNPKTRTSGEDVQLVFHHILTKLNVIVKKANTYKGKQVLKVNEVKIDNLAKQGYYEYTTGMTTNGWTTSDTYALDINTPYVLDKGSSTVTEYDNKYWIETLIFPQTASKKKAGAQPTADGLSSIYLYIQYQIGDELFDAYYDFADIWNSNLTLNGTYEFKQGSEYTLTITVGPEPIHFDAEVVVWDPESVELTVD